MKARTPPRKVAGGGGEAFPKREKTPLKGKKDREKRDSRGGQESLPDFSGNLPDFPSQPSRSTPLGLTLQVIGSGGWAWTPRRNGTLPGRGKN